MPKQEYVKASMSQDVPATTVIISVSVTPEKKELTCAKFEVGTVYLERMQHVTELPTKQYEKRSKLTIHSSPIAYQ